MGKPSMNRAAIGVRAHSGWGAVVAVTGDREAVRILDRRRIPVIDPATAGATQPYHFAKNLPPEEAQAHLERCAKMSHHLAATGLQELIESLRASGHRVIGCGVLLASGRPLPELAKILASHPLIHTAEGEFFRNSFVSACAKIGIPVQKFRERELFDCASAELRLSLARLKSNLTSLGRELGPPWTQDQKSATLAAWLWLAKLKSQG